VVAHCQSTINQSVIGLNGSDRRHRSIIDIIIVSVVSFECSSSESD
jgi:hypothetical protein